MEGEAHKPDDMMSSNDQVSTPSIMHNLSTEMKFLSASASQSAAASSPIRRAHKQIHKFDCVQRMLSLGAKTHLWCP